MAFCGSKKINMVTKSKNKLCPSTLDTTPELLCLHTQQVLWNFTNLCLVSLNITHNSNHVIINRLQRRVRANIVSFS